MGGQTGGMVRRMARVSLLAVLVGGAGCATALPPFDYTAEPDPRKKEFVLGPSDVVRVNVWKNPELSTDATVRPDGTISVPVVGELKVAGRTASHVRESVKQRLATFLKDVALEVEVSVREVNSYWFTVAGNVERGGLFNAKHYVTVSQALALAGGLNRYAELQKVVVIRTGEGGPRRIPIDVGAIYAGSRPEMDIVMLAEDTLYVP